MLADHLTEGRGIWSTIWGWITYPLTWWYTPAQPPVSDTIVTSSTTIPYEVTEIGKPNITVLCNDQTCMTIKCDEYGCRNITCNIYDTDLSGVCREYITIKPEKSPPPNKPISQPIDDSVVQTTSKVTTTSITTSLETDNNPVVDEQPLALEAILSSTVTKDVHASEELTETTATTQQ